MTAEEAIGLLNKYYLKGSVAYKYLYEHSSAVASYAVRIAKQNHALNPDIEFIHSAAFLHDIGIYLTDASKFGCFGELPYLAHGYLGRELLEKEGFPKHALVCERHVGVGISEEDIIKNELPLPRRDMKPLSIEEKIVCYADKFFTKKEGKLSTPKSPETILKNLKRYGPDKPLVFEAFMQKFGLPE